MKKILSLRQKQIFDFIEAYVTENKISPSIDEIGDALLLSNSTINTHLGAMIRKGWITKREGIPRSFRTVQPEAVN